MLPILCLDFDGVIHSYLHGWKGPRCIPDPPVEGALEFIVSATDEFQVHIFSSRSRYWFARWKIKQWLRHCLLDISGIDITDKWRIPCWQDGDIPYWWFRYITRTAFADPWVDEVEYAIRRLLHEIKWPLQKPPAHITIDDRAFCFKGEFPSIESIKSFTPWNRTTA